MADKYYVEIGFERYIRKERISFAAYQQGTSGSRRASEGTDMSFIDTFNGGRLHYKPSETHFISFTKES